jgi:hypothetical protein
MNMSQETINLIKQEIMGELQKVGWAQSGSATTGLTFYNLEGPSKKPIPFIIPLQDVIPSVTPPQGGGIQANWRAVTALNTAGVPATVPEGKRGGVVTNTVTEYFAAFRGIGLEDNVTFEAEYAAEGYEDLRATAQELLLKQTRIERERLILGGLGTFALGQTGKPVGTPVADAGANAMTARNVLCFVVALTLDGYRRSTVSAAGVPDTVTLTHAGPYGGTTTVNAGHAIISVASDAATADATHTSIVWTVAAVPGAFAYAWYTGITNSAGCHLAAITTVNKFTQVADESGTTQAANAGALGTDKSENALAYDGLISLATKSGSNGYYKSLNGASFTFDNAGGCVEIDAALADRWDNYRLGATDWYMSGADFKKFSKGTQTGTGTSIVRVNADAGTAQFAAGGMQSTSYTDGITGQVAQVHTHPDMPRGKVLGLSSSLPYPLSGITAVMRLLQRQGFRAWDWPIIQRQYEYGVYVDEVLQHYFPPSLIVIDNGVFA